MKKSTFVFCFFFYILVFAGNVNATVKITSLKDNDKIFLLLKEYNIYTNDCKLYLDRYSVIEGIEYYDMNNNLKDDGTIVVLDVLADSVVNIFRDLKKIHFNINKIHPTALYKKNWHGGVVMPDDFNGTESFVCRKIEHSDKLSLHSFGTALDINFLQNPCIFINEDTFEIKNIVPKNGAKYLNRSFKRKNKEEQDIGKVNTDVIRIFKKYGYDIWGGNWDFPIDYQHFQVSTRNFANLLINATKQDAKKFFNVHLQCLRRFDKSLIDITDDKEIDLLNEYTKNRNYLLEQIDNWCNINENK